MNSLEKFRQKFQAMSLDDRKVFLSSLNKNELLSLYANPDLFLFDKQIITGNQRYTILRCGRRFGKSVAGAAWMAKKILAGAKSLGLCGATHEDVAKVMVPALKAWFPFPLQYNQQNHTITGFKNKATIHCFTSDNEVRGYGLEYLWCDEICNWCDGIPEKVKERFDVLDMAVSAGKNPQTIITSTPKPFPLFIEWQKKIDEGHHRYKMLTGTMFDNPFLSQEYKDSQLEKLGNTRFGRQEIYGDLLLDVEGAAWNNKMIDDCRISYDDFKSKLSEVLLTVNERGIATRKNKLEINRVVVGVDPTVSDKPDGDECGIIIAALGTDNNVYILNDYSGQYTTDQWAQKSIKALDDYEAGMIVIEKNNGGELVKKNILAFDPSVPVKTITSVKGKIDRALPVAALYERHQVFHVMPKNVLIGNNVYEKLEHQMVHYTGSPKLKSPDRLDALVFAIHELRLSATYTHRDTSIIGSF